MRAFLICVVLVTAACSLTEPTRQIEPARRAWTALEVEDYRYDFQRECFCVREAVQPVTITVLDGVVTEVTSHESGERLPLAGPVSWPTFEQLLAEIEDARESGQQVEITYRSDGLPSRIEIGSLAADAGVVYVTGGFQALQ